MKNSFNKLKTIIVCALLTSLFVLPAIAQDMQGFKNKTAEQRARIQTGLMKSKLQLDSVQTTKAQTINLKYAQKMEPLLTSPDSRLTRLQQAMSIQKEKDAELKKVFTAGQYQQYQAFEKQLKEKAMARIGN